MAIRMLPFALVVISACIGLSTFTSAENKAVRPDGKLRELLIERRDVLLERHKSIESVFKNGDAVVTAVISAENELLDAELALATQPADRITIFEKLVLNMKRIEDWTHQQVNDGTATRIDVLLAKAARLQAEIAVLRERGSGQ